jgi:hypothetical protein
MFDDISQDLILVIFISLIVVAALYATSGRSSVQFIEKLAFVNAILVLVVSQLALRNNIKLVRRRNTDAVQSGMTSSMHDADRTPTFDVELPTHLKDELPQTTEQLEERYLMETMDSGIFGEHIKGSGAGSTGGVYTADDEMNRARITGSITKTRANTYQPRINDMMRANILDTIQMSTQNPNYARQRSLMNSDAG